MFWPFDKSAPNDRSYSVPITQEILKNVGTAASVGYAASLEIPWNHDPPGELGKVGLA